MSIDAPGLRARATVLAALRGWLAQHGYLEVPTPVLVPSGAMEEHLHPVVADGGVLRTSPEFALKRVLAAGLPRIYELGPCLRDRERGDWHGREFLMLEWYRAGAGLQDAIAEVQALVATSAAALGLAAPTWQQRTVRSLFLEHTGHDLATVAAAELCPSDPDHAFMRRWVEDVEPTFEGALVVTEWPVDQAALAEVRPHRAYPVACRFEAFLDGVELANAFLELRDAETQRVRFDQANEAREATGDAPHAVDDAFVEAVGQLPPSAGVALGVDRLVAALMGWSGIGPGRVT